MSRHTHGPAAGVDSVVGIDAVSPNERSGRDHEHLSTRAVVDSVGIARKPAPDQAESSSTIVWILRLSAGSASPAARTFAHAWSTVL